MGEDKEHRVRFALRIHVGQGSRPGADRAHKDQKAKKN